MNKTICQNSNSKMNKKQKILVLEPFYGGSHKQFIDMLMTLSVNYDLVLGDSLPKEAIKKSSKWPDFEFKLYEMKAKKWHWRSRTSALYMSQIIPKSATDCVNNSVDHSNSNSDIQFDVLFVSSILNLSELLALRPDLAKIRRKIIYFHENQLVYPIQVQKERDFQYGYNQILSCLVADEIVFNSNYNRQSFLQNIKPFVKIMPDYRPPNVDQLITTIEQKSQVIYYPIKFCNIPLMHARTREKSILHIVWPHRWEHDKNPESFFRILYQLKEDNVRFKVSILGETFSEIPKIFEDCKQKLSNEIVNFGYVESKDDYYQILSAANVVISTANHEFFGVSMLEAAYCGCFPLCPTRLVYPELFPAQYLYGTEDDCIQKLKQFALTPEKIPMPLDIAFEMIDWIYCQDKYKLLFSCPANISSDSSSSATAPSATAASVCYNHRN